MATFDARFHEEAFQSMESRRKTVYALVATDEYRFMSSGDRLEFGNQGSITVGTVRHYPHLERLVEVEGWQALFPDAASADAAIAEVRAIEDWDNDAEQSHGVLSLRVRVARRKD